MANTDSNWQSDLIALAKWAIQSEDLRHRFIYADKPSELSDTPGIIYTLETSIVLAIFEAAVSKGYKRAQLIAYERPYPGETGGNPKRADLAFKESGRGKNWSYVEVKCYGVYGKSALTHDIKKLKSIEQRSQRWILCYRVRPLEGRSKKLKSILEKNFSADLNFIYESQSVPTISDNGSKGECEIILARVK